MHPARRVLLVSTNYPPQVGGVEQVVSHLARYLAARGDAVTVVTSRAGSRFWGREREEGVTVHRVFLGVPGAGWRATILFPFLAPLTVVYLIGVVVRYRPELIHLHFADNATAYALVLAALFRLPLVVSLHGDDAERLPQERPINRWLLRVALRRAAVVTGCSAALLRRAGTSGARVVANGIDAEWTAEEPVAGRDGYLLTLARLVPKKGVDTVIRALAALPSRHSGVALKVAGDGPTRQELEALSAACGLAERVEFLGQVAPGDVPALIAGCRLFVLGSRREPFGIVLLEALGLGRPVVATNAGGIPEIIEDGVHGLLVPPDEAELMAAAITRLLDDPALAERLGRQGQVRVRAEFTLQKQGEKFRQLYEDVLARAG